jgi:hypothetical protein
VLCVPYLLRLHLFLIFLALTIKSFRDMTSYRWVYKYQSFIVACCPHLQGSSLSWNHVPIYTVISRKTWTSIITAQRTSKGSHIVFSFLSPSKCVSITAEHRILIASKRLCHASSTGPRRQIDVWKFEFNKVEDGGVQRCICAFIGNYFFSPTFLSSRE